MKEKKIYIMRTPANHMKYNFQGLYCIYVLAVFCLTGTCTALERNIINLPYRFQDFTFLMCKFKTLR